MSVFRQTAGDVSRLQLLPTRPAITFGPQSNTSFRPVAALLGDRGKCVNEQIADKRQRKSQRSESDSEFEGKGKQ